MTVYFDKQGKKIELRDWVRLFEDKEYQIVAQEILPNGVHVSTAWLGLEHGAKNGKPYIFETIVFVPLDEHYTDNKETCRYTNLEDAKKGHKELVEKWKGIIRN